MSDTFDDDSTSLDDAPEVEPRFTDQLAELDKALRYVRHQETHLQYRLALLRNHEHISAKGISESDRKLETTDIRLQELHLRIHGEFLENQIIDLLTMELVTNCPELRAEWEQIGGFHEYAELLEKQNSSAKNTGAVKDEEVNK